MDDEEIPYDHDAEDSMPQNNSIQQSENSEATMQEQNSSSLK